MMKKRFFRLFANCILVDGSTGSILCDLENRNYYDIPKRVSSVLSEFEKREKPLPQFFDSDTKTVYRVKSGDYLGKIARIYGVRVSQIKQWNGLRSNNLNIGQRLTIYPRNPSTNVSVVSQKTTPKTVDINGKKTYKVQKGDSLWSISQKFSGVSVQNIKDWNDISGTKLMVGMTLIVSE